MNEFLGKKAVEKVEGEIVKKTIPQEPSIFKELKQYEKWIKEGVDFAGLDYNKFKKELGSKIKSLGQQLLNIKKPHEQKPTKTAFSPHVKPFKTVQSSDNEPKQETQNKMTKIDLNKIFVGLELFLDFADKQDLTIGELQTYIKSKDAQVKSLLDEKYLNGMNLLFKLSGEDKKIVDLKQFLEENQSLIEGFLS